MAASAGVGRWKVVKLEAGELGDLFVHDLIACFDVLGARIDIDPRWRGAALDLPQRGTPIRLIDPHNVGEARHLTGWHLRVRTRRTSTVAFLATIVGLFAACALLPGGNERQVTSADFGDDWPLTVESGALACEGTDSITFHTGGKTYAVSVPSSFGEPIDPIWADDPTDAPSKKDLWPLERAGLELCP